MKHLATRAAIPILAAVGAELSGRSRNEHPGFFFYREAIACIQCDARGGELRPAPGAGVFGRIRVNCAAIRREPGGALTSCRRGSRQYAARFTEKGYSTVQANEQRADEYRLHAEQLRARADQLSFYPATRDLLLDLVAQYQELAASIEQPPRG